jgi:hypothetical protein
MNKKEASCNMKVLQADPWVYDRLPTKADDGQNE